MLPFCPPRLGEIPGNIDQDAGLCGLDWLGRWVFEFLNKSAKRAGKWTLGTRCVDVVQRLEGMARPIIELLSPWGGQPSAAARGPVSLWLSSLGNAESGCLNGTPLVDGDETG